MTGSGVGCQEEPPALGLCGALGSAGVSLPLFNITSTRKVPGSVQGQVAQGLEQPGIAKDWAGGGAGWL